MAVQGGSLPCKKDWKNDKSGLKALSEEYLIYGNLIDQDGLWTLVPPSAEKRVSNLKLWIFVMSPVKGT